uniref:HTH CENPB-type domain-containing protein n=1 Tax=Meloidogyne hapla TaxID=6305 RepID=A0A1I8AXZ5_MELHA
MNNLEIIDEEIDVETLSNGEGPSEKKARHSYTVEKKLEVIQFAKKYGNNVAHKRFGVCRGSVIQWIKQEESFLAMNKKSTKSRLPGAGRHLLNSNLDEEIFEWFNELRKKKQRVTRRMIQTKAKELYSQFNILEEEKTIFVASNGWVQTHKA